MKSSLTLTFIIFASIFCSTKAQYAYGDRWYQNPLGFKPLNLHASMGVILPAAAVGTCLALTEKNPTIKQKLSVYAEVSPAFGYKYPYTFLPQTNAGINYQLRNFMSVGVEFGAIFPTDDYNNTVGLDIKPFARFYPVNNDKWRLFFESGGGLVYTLSQFPKPTNKDDRLGLYLNGITKYGIGSDINISANMSLTFGVRHVHISNGNTKGVERNPSHDSNGIFAGISYRLKY